VRRSERPAREDFAESSRRERRTPSHWSNGENKTPWPLIRSHGCPRALHGQPTSKLVIDVGNNRIDTNTSSNVDRSNACMQGSAGLRIPRFDRVFHRVAIG
jgi:hypothetical protein